MKHTFYSLLPLFLLLDLVIPFLLAPTYPGYRHTRQVMSVLGNRSAPFHTVYTLWLLFLGTAILLTCAQLCPLLWGRSGGLSLALAAILIIYALGGCILSGLFPVSETKAMETLSAKIHGFGSVLGFLALTFAPLVVALFYFKGRQTSLALCALTCFILALVFFVLFVMADKPRFAHTVIAWEGLWQRLTLLFIAATVVISLIIYLIMRATVPIYHEAQNGLDKVTLLTRENYVGARVVRAFSRQADELTAFVETNDHLRSIQTMAGRISALMNPLTYLVINLAIIALLMRGSHEVNNGALTQGEIIALINYMNQILVSLLRLADLVISVTRALASGMRVNEILNTHTTMPDPAAAELDAEPAAPAVAFDDVTFTYNGAGAPSLTNVSFTAKPGETIGVIGGTGSGKSTLIDLVCRFYDATTGTVSLFGHNVKEYGFTQLRRMVGIVPQQAVLFTGTIRDNMRWAAPDATDEEIWQALEIAQAADFVHTKPGMLDAPVETAGRNFSGGQRQRLTIARALVPKPKVLILDDSASALDFATDAALRKAIKEKTEGMTVFIVSQRAASVQRADHILVLDDGVLTGDATHSQLLKTCEVYKEICLSQLSKEEVEKTL